LKEEEIKEKQVKDEVIEVYKKVSDVNEE